MEYVLLVESDRNLLNRQVNRKLKEGWELFGPPSGAANPYGDGKTMYLQALTRDDS
jgi:hypothetical protein